MFTVTHHLPRLGALRWTQPYWVTARRVGACTGGDNVTRKGSIPPLSWLRNREKKWGWGGGYPIVVAGPRTRKPRCHKSALPQPPFPKEGTSGRPDVLLSLRENRYLSSTFWVALRRMRVPFLTVQSFHEYPYQQALHTQPLWAGCTVLRARQ